MIYNSNGKRYDNYHNWEVVKYNGYNYEKFGLLQKIMSNKIVNTNNNVLKIILNYYETSLIFLMRYVDILKNFKNTCWKNR